MARCRPWEGSFYRSASPEWASSGDLVSGEGSAETGGRWNPPGIRTVYGSLSAELSLAEALAATRVLGVPDRQALPKVTVSGWASLVKVVQLDRAVRAELGTGLSELLDPDWKSSRTEVLSQKLGRLAFGLGMEGLLVPSAVDRRRGVNLVAFPDNLGPASRLEAEGLTPRSRRRGVR